MCQVGLWCLRIGAVPSSLRFRKAAGGVHGFHRSIDAPCVQGHIRFECNCVQLQVSVRHSARLPGPSLGRQVGRDVFSMACPGSKAESQHAASFWVRSADMTECPARMWQRRAAQPCSPQLVRTSAPQR